MKSEWKIPFKKLSWKDNITEYGKEKGLIEWIGESHPGTGYFIKFYVSNSNQNDKLNKFSIHCTVNKDCLDGKNVEFDNLDIAREHCQRYYESYIIKTFFENDGRAVQDVKRMD